jgi:hypothetical protein
MGVREGLKDRGRCGGIGFGHRRLPEGGTTFGCLEDREFGGLGSHYTSLAGDHFVALTTSLRLTASERHLESHADPQESQ